MRISDWSSDVCSSDLADRLDLAAVGLAAQAKLQIGEGLREAACRIGDALRILVVDLAHEGLQPQQRQHDILLRLAGAARDIELVPAQGLLDERRDHLAHLLAAGLQAVAEQTKGRLAQLGDAAEAAVEARSEEHTLNSSH